MRSADNNGAGSPPRQHRAEVAAAEQVHVKMRHLLMGGGSGIGKDTIAAVGYPGAVDGYQVNFRVPSDTARGAATIQVAAAWIMGPAAQIAISGGWAKVATCRSRITQGLRPLHEGLPSASGSANRVSNPLPTQPGW